MKRGTIALLVVLVLAVAGGGALLAWDLFLRGDNVAPLGLDTPAPTTVAGAATPSPAPPATPAASQATGGGPYGGGADDYGTGGRATPAPVASAAPGGTASLDALAGSWAVAEGAAGYRVRETFLDQQADSDAVGRTDRVSGSLSLALDGGALTATGGRFEVDMTTLKSDRDRRDGALRDRGIESDRFPTSTFALTRPVVVPAALADGQDVSLVLAGDLVLHGVTRAVEIPAQARLEADGRVVVAGSLPIVFADYGIEPPSVAGLIAVQDEGALEFRIVLAKG